MKKTRTKTLAVVALTSAMTACVAGGIGYAKLNHAVFASADTANYYAERSNVFSGTGTLTQTESATFALTGVKAGQYSVTVEITHTEGTSQDWFYLSATGNGEAVFLNEGTETEGNPKYYGVVNVDENGTLTISSTSANTLSVSVTLENLFMSEGNGYSLGNVLIPTSEMPPLDVEIRNTAARTFTVQVDLSGRILGTGETLTAYINDESAVLTAQTADLALYSGTITLPEDETATSLTIESTIVASEGESVVGSIALFPLGTATPITDKTATATNVPVWETAIFSYTPSETSYQTVAITSTASPLYTSTTVSTVAGTFSGSPVAGEDYPVYLEANTTYYFEVTLSGTDEEGKDVGYTSADLTITLNDWKRPTIEVGGSYALPVTTADETPEMFTLTAAEGTYDLTITEVPFDYYIYGVTVTAHITYAAGTPAVQEVVLDSDHNYSASVEIAANAESIYFTTSQDSRSVIRVSLTVPEVIHYIVPGESTDITVPANGSVTYFIEAAKAGVYSLNLTKTSSSISVMVGDVTIIPAGKTMGGFVVQYEGNDFGITFVNSSDAEVEITAMVAAEAQDTTIQLNEEKTITLAANQRQAFFMYSLAAGDFTLSITPATTTGIALEVDGVPVTLTDGKATITISDIQDTNGLVNFTFENTGDESVTFTVMVTPEHMVNVGEEFEITVAGYYNYVAYYVGGFKANTEYYMVLDLPEGVSATVSQNGEEFVYYGNAIGVFTADSDGYITMRFSIYAYGDFTTVTAYIDEYEASTEKTMTLNTATNITVEGRYTTYTLNLTRGLYYISVLGDVEATINGTLVSNSISYYVDAAEGQVVTVRVTFINFTGATATATATVVTDVMNVGEEKTITLAADSSNVYGINLERGLYTLTLSASENIEVQLDNVVVVPENGIYRLNVAMSGGHTLTFVNTGASEVSFTATVTPENLLTLGEEKAITLGANGSEVYYINLETGYYRITLTFADGSRIQVLFNGREIISAGVPSEEFRVTLNGYNALTFVNEANVEVTFSVVVNAVE